MEAGYRIWSHIEEFEIGKARVMMDIWTGNVMVIAGGMVWNSADGMWRICGETRLGEGVWMDGIGGRHEVCAEGNVVRDGRGNWVRFSRGGETERALVDGQEVEFTYTGGLLTALEGFGERRVFGYCGEKVAVVGGRETAFFEYDGDLISRMRFADGGEAEFLYEGGRLVRVRSEDEDVEIGYDEMGRSVRIGDVGILHGDGVRTVGEWRYFFDGERCVGAEYKGEMWKFDCNMEFDIGDYLWV